ncbi:hypothetical protein LKMONMHP_2633 [Methylobacterium organophilum]|uniref:Uncharacterized protein n=1 Tax=Methylobacterium organophilum TaxID=410 RepID=A0ABQ4TCI8_METOR|nr:hypothetical protein LKMONMHP_2633 [Methylobacterium organophilum]
MAIAVRAATAASAAARAPGSKLLFAPSHRMIREARPPGPRFFHARSPSPARRLEQTGHLNQAHSFAASDNAVRLPS